MLSCLNIDFYRYPGEKIFKKKNQVKMDSESRTEL